MHSMHVCTHRFEAAKDKMSDEYSPLDTDNKAFVAMMLNATQASGRGSAGQAALPLQAVLSDQSNTLAGTWAGL